MQHSVKFVAECQWLPEQELVEFALQNQSKYGIYQEDGIAYTSTWYTNDLTNDFRAAYPELCSAYRYEYLAKLNEGKNT